MDLEARSRIKRAYQGSLPLIGNGAEPGAADAFVPAEGAPVVRSALHWPPCTCGADICPDGPRAEECVRCGRPVEATPETEVSDGFSASGARPALYAHPDCGSGVRR